MDRREYKRKWYQENKERVREKNNEAQRRYRLRHPDKIKEYKQSEARKISDKKYYESHIEQLKIKRVNWYKDNPEYNKGYYQKHKEKYNKTSKEWKKRNYQYKRMMDRKWKQDNPDKVLKSNLRQIENDSGIIGMDSAKYKWALQAWSQTIKKRDGKCVICDSKDNLTAHHILYRKYCPKLSFNINNGITLCFPHHQETHGNNLIYP